MGKSKAELYSAYGNVWPPILISVSEESLQGKSLNIVL